MTQKGNAIFSVLAVLFFAPVVQAQSLELIRKIPHSGYSEGLDYYQGFLWNSQPKAIVKIDPKDGSVLSRFTPATDYSESLTFFGGKIWNVSFSDNGIYSGKIEGERINFKRVGSTPEKAAWGFTNDGKRLILTGTYNSAVLYFMDPTTLKVIRRLTTTVKDLEDLAWDGKWIWASSFRSHRGEIFRIEPKTGTVTDFFSLSDPENCPLIDGIAFDGKGLWVTGKHCPSIYYFKLPK
jgi:glutamine cyclotransferase